MSVVLRFRRARGVERQQLRWLLAAGLLVAAAFVARRLRRQLDGRDDVGIAITLLAVLAIPVAIGVAMLRYRLYEIDRVISKTLVYGAVTVILGAAYAGLVLAGQAVFSSFAGGSNLAIAVSTLAVAVLFLPLRSRVQSVVDRRFYRRRYDAQRTLETFGARLREEVDLATLRRRAARRRRRDDAAVARVAVAARRSPAVSRRTATIARLVAGRGQRRARVHRRRHEAGVRERVGLALRGERRMVIAVFLASGIVGALVASRLPSNPIGWIFVGLVVALGFSGLSSGLRRAGNRQGPARRACSVAGALRIGLVPRLLRGARPHAAAVPDRPSC